MAKFVDLAGLETFLSKMKEWTNSAINTAKTALQTNIDKKVDKTTTVNGHALSGNVTVTKSDVGLSAVTNDAQVKRSEMGAPSGVATLGTDGKVPSAQLPSYVDDVVEFNGRVSVSSGIQDSSTAASDLVVSYNTSNKKFVAVTGGKYYNAWAEKNGYAQYVNYGTSTTDGVTPEDGKIYVDKSNNKTYRWSGSDLVEISASLALGTTSSTAFRGDYGNTAYQHATKKGAAFGAGLYKITTNSEGHVTAATAVTKNDITALGIPGEQGSYTLPQATSSVLGGVKLGSDTVQTVAAGTPSATDGKTYAVQKDSSGKMVVNVPWTNTTYSKATQSADGLMSKEDKKTLDGLNTFGADGIVYYDDAKFGFGTSVPAGGDGEMSVSLRIPYAIVVDGYIQKETGGISFPNATTSAPGAMTAADKTKLNGIAAGATADSAVTTSEIEALFD